MLSQTEIVEAASQRLGLYGYLQTGHKPAPHHRVIINVLSDETPGTKDLVIMPPGHAKTTWGTTLGVAHYLGRHPDRSVLILSESGPRAQELFSSIQEQFESPLFQAIFPDFKPDKARGWTKTRLYSTKAPKHRPDPTLACAGVGGSVIGRRPDLIVIDDPTNESIATSPARRQAQELWFKRTLLTRLTKTAKVIVIMTRWHEADLAGFLTNPELTEELGDLKWRYWHLPAFAEKGLVHPPELYQSIFGGEEGRPLWPDQYPREVLLDKKAPMGEAVFRCVYQGDPSDLGGALFKMQYLTGYNETWVNKLVASRRGRGDRIEVFQFWDLAFSEEPKGVGGDPDYTVGITVGVDRSDRYYVLDVFRTRKEDVDVIVDSMVALARDWQPKLVGIEKVAAQKLVVGLAKKRFRQRFGPKSPPVIGVGVDRDKTLRARLPVSLTEPTRHPDDPERLMPGKLRFNHRAPWWPKFRQELLSFPASAHDDQVDALSGVTALASKRANRVIRRARVG